MGIIFKIDCKRGKSDLFCCEYYRHLVNLSKMIPPVLVGFLISIVPTTSKCVVHSIDKRVSHVDVIFITAMLLATLLLSKVEVSSMKEAALQNFAGGLILSAVAAEFFPILLGKSTSRADSRVDCPLTNPFL